MATVLDIIQDISTLGVTTSQAFTGTAARVTMLSTGTIRNNVPATFLLLADQDCYIRQGDSTVVADSNDFLLKANTYVRITVTGLVSNYLSVIQSSSSGTLRVTLNSSLTPGSD